MRLLCACVIMAGALVTSASAQQTKTYDSGFHTDSFGDSEGFYLTLFGGLTLADDIDYSSSAGDSGTLVLEPGYSVGKSLGYDFGNGLSVEGQLGYLNAALDSATYGSDSFDAMGSVSALYGMVNAWYGFDIGGFTPFIGGGVGVVNLMIDSAYAAPFEPAGFEDSAVTWGAQLGGGIALEISDELEIFGRARFLTTGEVTLTDGQDDEVTAALTTEILDLGLKFSF